MTAMIGGTERRACEFQLLRYVPDAVRNEYVHIGVILREQGSARVRRYASPVTGAGCAALILMPTRRCWKDGERAATEAAAGAAGTA